MVRFFGQFFKDRRGATMIEYGVLAAIMSLAAIPTYHIIGGTLIWIFGAASTQIARAIIGL